MSDEILEQYETMLTAGTVPDYFLLEQFCNSGAINIDYVIPPVSSPDPAVASLETGAPILQQVKPSLGGAVFPRAQYNGALRLLSNILAYLNKGNLFTFDARNVDGYSSGAVLFDYATNRFVTSLHDNNTANFVTNPTLINDIDWKFITVTNVSYATQQQVFDADPLANDAVVTANLMNFKQTGTGAALYPLVSKMQQTLSVKDFNAKGDGVTNDTAAIQAAINTLSANGGRLYITNGVFLCSGLVIPANVVITGNGANSVLKQNGTSAILICDSGNSTAFVDNIQINNLKLLGTVATDGFSEFIHLISFNGVRNCNISYCILEGYRGDGIYIGSGIAGEQERHNYNVTIQNNVINGVNKDNRNGISVIDCNGLTIQNNYIINSSRNNMPGAIDLEPNNNTYHVLTNINITGNYIRDCGGNVGQISVYVPPLVPAPTNINISSNYLVNNTTAAGSSYGISFRINRNLTATDKNQNIAINNNFLQNGTGGLFIPTGKGINIENNNIQQQVNGVKIGYIDSTASNIKFVNNTLDNCGNGTSDKVGLAIFGVNYLDIISNQFVDCGNGSAGSYAIDFNQGSSSYVTLNNNIITSPNGNTLVAVVKEGSHTFDPTTNQMFENVFSGLNATFAAYQTDYCELSNANVYSPAILPLSFPYGTSTTLVNGVAGLPAGYSQGTLVTEKISTAGGWITQYFNPRGITGASLINQYIRKNNSSNANAWSEWFASNALAKTNKGVYNLNYFTGLCTIAGVTDYANRTTTITFTTPVINSNFSINVLINPEDLAVALGLTPITYAIILTQPGAIANRLSSGALSSEDYIFTSTNLTPTVWNITLSGSLADGARNVAFTFTIMGSF